MFWIKADTYFDKNNFVMNNFPGITVPFTYGFMKIHPTGLEEYIWYIMILGTNELLSKHFYAKKPLFMGFISW